jgi:hypothetical protein
MTIDDDDARSSIPYHTYPGVYYDEWMTIISARAMIDSDVTMEWEEWRYDDNIHNIRIHGRHLSTPTLKLGTT